MPRSPLYWRVLRSPDTIHAAVIAAFVLAAHAAYVYHRHVSYANAGKQRMWTCIVAIIVSLLVALASTAVRLYTFYSAWYNRKVCVYTHLTGTHCKSEKWPSRIRHQLAVQVSPADSALHTVWACDAHRGIMIGQIARPAPRPPAPRPPGSRPASQPVQRGIDVANSDLVQQQQTYVYSDEVDDATSNTASAR